MHAVKGKNVKEKHIAYTLTYSPLVMFNLSCSFSHDAKDALSASAIVLFVPGVSGGTCVGISVRKGPRINKKQNQFA